MGLNRVYQHYDSLNMLIMSKYLSRKKNYQYSIFLQLILQFITSLPPLVYFLRLFFLQILFLLHILCYFRFYFMLRSSGCLLVSGIPRFSLECDHQSYTSGAGTTLPNCFSTNISNYNKTNNNVFS